MGVWAAGGKLVSAQARPFQRLQDTVGTGTDVSPTDDDTTTVAVSLQAQATTSDFAIKRLMAELPGHQFEEFVAHLLECLGYTARVTPKSGDGGVDVIAHMDPLGFQPPIIRVQCKRTTSQTPRPDVDQLLGAPGDGGYGLFVNLGSFARGAVEVGAQSCQITLDKWRAVRGTYLRTLCHSIASVSFNDPTQENIRS
jgi:predicted Mrr-cat superfamily restriction endonuclease